MQRLSSLAILFFLLNITPAQAQTANSDNGDAAVNANSDVATPKKVTLSTNRKISVFALSKIDQSAVKEFQKAWKISGNGTNNVEGLVLIFANPDGSYKAQSGGRTNEFRKFTFTWNPNILAIVHTHPRNQEPKPNGQDIPLSNRFGIPVLTLTIRGMYMYDPGTKKISKIKDGLNWLEPSSWRQTQTAAVNK